MRTSSGEQLAGFLAGAVLGALLLGLGGRLAMSVIQVTHGFPMEWSWGGTWQVILPGAALGPAAGLAYALARPHLPPARLAGGLVFGSAHAALWVAIYFLRPAGPIELSGAPIMGSALFAGLLLAFGVALAWLEERWRPACAERRVPAAAMVAMWALAAAGFGLTLWVLVSR
jgi:hypothetical protein